MTGSTKTVLPVQMKRFIQLFLLTQRKHWKKKVITNFEAKPIQQQIFKDGKCVYKKPAYEDIVKYAAAEIDTLWDEITRFENPHTYYVDLSQKLWEVKNFLLAENNRQTAD